MSVEQNKGFYQTNHNEEEISLYDIYRVLNKRKKLVLIVFAAVLLFCAAYLLIMPRIYHVSATLLPPLPGDMYMPNLPVSSIEMIDGYAANLAPISMLKLSSRMLTSNELWQGFKSNSKSPLPGSTRVVPASNPFVARIDNDPVESLILEYNTKQKEYSAELVKQYLHYAEPLITSEFIKQATEFLKLSQKTDMQYIQYMKATEEQKILDRTAKLARVVAEAKKLDILNNLRINVDVKADDGILDKLQELRVLKQVRPSDGFRAYQLASPVMLTASPIKHIVKLVLVLGGFFGLILGVISAFVADFLSRMREKELAEA